MSNEWKQGPCQCLNDVGLCCFVAWCPCLAFKEATENIGQEQDGTMYCLATCCGCGCCVLTVLGQSVAEKANIENSMGKSALFSFFNGCLCYACTVAQESRALKSGKSGAPAGQKMERK